MGWTRDVCACEGLWCGGCGLCAAAVAAHVDEPAVDRREQHGKEAGARHVARRGRVVRSGRRRRVCAQRVCVRRCEAARRRHHRCDHRGVAELHGEEERGRHAVLREPQAVGRVAERRDGGRVASEAGDDGGRQALLAALALVLRLGVLLGQQRVRGSRVADDAHGDERRVDVGDAGARGDERRHELCVVGAVGEDEGAGPAVALDAWVGAGREEGAGGGGVAVAAGKTKFVPNLARSISMAGCASSFAAAVFPLWAALVSGWWPVAWLGSPEGCASAAPPPRGPAGQPWRGRWCHLWPRLMSTEGCASSRRHLVAVLGGHDEGGEAILAALVDVDGSVREQPPPPRGRSGQPCRGRWRHWPRLTSIEGARAAALVAVRSPVAPFLSPLLTSVAECERSRATTAPWPYPAATTRGVYPLSSMWLGSIDGSESSRETSASSPLSAAA